jgi:hypothetical protein
MITKKQAELDDVPMWCIKAQIYSSLEENSKTFQIKYEDFLAVKSKFTNKINLWNTKVTENILISNKDFELIEKLFTNLIQK